MGKNDALSPLLNRLGNGNMAGKILNQTTTITGPKADRKSLKKGNPACAGTSVRDNTAHDRPLRRLQTLGGSTAVPSDLWIVGDIFLRKYAVILDFEHERLGVATVVPISGRSPVPAVQGVEALQQEW